MTRSIAPPDMGLVIPNFIMEGMVDCDGRPSNLIDPVHMMLKVSSMSVMILDRLGDEKVRVDHLMQQSIDVVRLWPKLE